MDQPGYQIDCRPNPANGDDWLTTSNNVISVVELPYGRCLDDALLRQVLAQFSVELRSPMSEETVAQIEEETPEVLAMYDLPDYEETDI